MILIVNFGSQVTHLIGRRLRQLEVFSEIKPLACVTNDDLQKASGIILSGGPDSVQETCDKIDAIFQSKKPILGLCYGHQLIAHHFGGTVTKNNKRQYGCARMTVLSKDDLFTGLDNTEMVWMSHGDTVQTLPKDFKALGESSGHSAAMAHRYEKIFGLQFHPEVHHTKHGQKILQNFISICRAPKNWKIADQKNTIIRDIQNKVGNAHVIMAVSGGVDSTVAATILHQAIGDRITCIFVDTGLMRKKEPQEVANMYANLGFKHFHTINAQKTFLTRLEDVTDPEEKRKIIGHTFIEIFEQAVQDMKASGKNFMFLGQGTIYPDTIESAQSQGPAAKIKSHHNVTLPENMKLQLIEPLRDLYKDEVRELGINLGIENEFLFRHPFPGPGLAVRILGSITQEKINIVKQADDIFISTLKKTGYYHKTWQAFAALLPVKTVGVMGDSRTYEYMISLRAVTSQDAMTADWAKLPDTLLQEVSTSIINEVKGVNRVVYDITQKPPGTIEYE